MNICDRCYRKPYYCDLRAHKGGGETISCTSFKPQTNADRIRAMTDEELADLLAKHGMVLEWNCNEDGIKTRVFSPTNPESKMLDWLKREGDA